MSRQLDLIVQGSLGTNPVVSRTSSGRLFCYFRVATAPSFRIEDVWREGPTIWFTAKAWGYLAENLARSLHKGDPVVLVGRFSQDLWENDRGQQLTNVLTVSCGGPDLTWGESRFMRVSRTARTVDAESTTTSAGSAPSSPSADTASESESVAAAVGLQKTGRHRRTSSLIGRSRPATRWPIRCARRHSCEGRHWGRGGRRDP